MILLRSLSVFKIHIMYLLGEEELRMGKDRFTYSLLYALIQTIGVMIVICLVIYITDKKGDISYWLAHPFSAYPEVFGLSVLPFFLINITKVFIACYILDIIIYKPFRKNNIVMILISLVTVGYLFFVEPQIVRPIIREIDSKIDEMQIEIEYSRSGEKKVFMDLSSLELGVFTIADNGKVFTQFKDELIVSETVFHFLYGYGSAYEFEDGYLVQFYDPERSSSYSQYYILKDISENTDAYKISTWMRMWPDDLEKNLEKLVEGRTVVRHNLNTLLYENGIKN